MASITVTQTYYDDDSIGVTTNILEQPFSTLGPQSSNQTRRLSLRRHTSLSTSSALGLYNTKLLSNSTSSLKQKPKVENTYKLEPERGKSLNTQRIHEMAYKILEEKLKGEKYNWETCSKTVCDLSTVIKNKLKKLNMPRYKFVSHVVIGQQCDQGVQVGSRCLWRPNTDTYQQISYNNDSLFVVATVFAIYLE